MKRKSDHLDATTAEFLSTPTCGWVSVTAVHNRIQEHRPRHIRPGFGPHSLEQRAKDLRLDVSAIGRIGVAVLVRDLGRLFSPPELEVIAGDLDELQAERIDLPAARTVVGMTQLRTHELVGLLERRGISVEWPGPHGSVSLSACCWLNRLLVAERSWRGVDADFLTAEVALPLIRLAGPADVAGDGEILDAEEELDRRCRLWDVRGPSRRIEETWREYTIELASGFDIFRITGASAPGADVAAYRRQLAGAYKTVLGDQAGAVEEPSPQPGQWEPESEQIITHGGRKYLVEAGA